MITALVLTILIETICLMLLKEKNKIVYFIEVVINIVTNLSLNLFLQTYYFESNLEYAFCVIILEAIIFIIEGIIYNIYYKNIKKALQISFILNITSFMIGLVIGFIQNFDYFKQILIK